MIRQNDDRLYPAIQKEGCYLMDLFYFANKINNTKISCSIINEYYELFVLQKYIDKDCTINDPDAIFKHLGVDATYTDKHEPISRMCKDNEIEILCYTWKYGPHFVCGDGYGHVTYDSWGNSLTCKYGKLISKRIFKIKR